MKKYSKRILAFLCAGALVVTTVLGGGTIRMTQAADTAPTPVKLDGFTNVTTTSLVKQYTTDEGMQDKEYGNGENVYYLPNETSFDKKLFTAWVKYTDPDMTNWWSNGICFGAPEANGWGLRLVPTDNGASLRVADADMKINTATQIMESVNASAVGLDSFIGTEFLLQIGYEFTDDNNDGVGDLRILVYVNGNKGLDIVKENCNQNALGNFVRVIIYTNAKISVKAADLSEDTTPTPPTPVELDGFTNVTTTSLIKQYTTDEGMQDKEYGNGENVYYLPNETSFDKKLFTAWVKYTDPDMTNWWNNGICFGAPETNGWGLRLVPMDNGASLRVADADMKINTATQIMESVNASAVGLDSFIGTEFLLQIGYEFTDDNNDGVGDLRILVYVNGNKGLDIVKENCNQNALGNFVRVIIYTNAKISVKAADLSEDTTPTPPTPVELEGFTNVTVGDFVYAGTENPMEEKQYTEQADFQLKEGNDFDQKLFTANIKFDGAAGFWNNRICIGGTANNGWGVALCLDKENDALKIAEFDSNIDEDPSETGFERTITKDTAKVDTFINTEFLLQIGLEYLDNDNGGTKNDVRVLVYVNGNAAFNEVFSNCNMDRLGNYMRFYLGNGSSLTVSAVETQEDTTPTVPTPVELEGFTNVTVGDFVYAGTENPMEEKQYTEQADFQLKEGNDFDQKLFTANIKFDGAAGFWNNRICIGGTANNGWGVALCLDKENDVLKIAEFDSNIDEDPSETGFERTITKDTAKVDTFINTEFLLQIGLEYLDNDNGGTKNDVRVLVYVNGNAAFNEVFSNCNMDRLGNYMRFYLGNGSSLTVSAVETQEDTTPTVPETPGEIIPVELDGFDNLTIKDFVDVNGAQMPTGRYEGFDYGAYNDYYVDGLTNLNKKLLSMKIKYEGGQFKHSLVVGGAGEWSGFNLYPNADGSSLLIDCSWAGSIINVDTYQISTLNASDAGVGSFIGEEFLLQLSFEYGEMVGGKADLTMGVYINGKLYNNAPIVIPGCNVSGMGSHLALYRQVEGSAIILDNVVIGDESDIPMETQQPNEKFEKITFEYFGIANGIYKFNGSGAPTFEGKGSKTLNQKVLCGDVLITGKGNDHLMVGGGDNVWYGLRFITQENGTIQLHWIDADGGIPIEVFNPTTAKATLIGEWVNLMISTEIVDADGDGSKDDIEVGVWFNGVLYKNKFYTVIDKAAGLGKYIGYYSGVEGNAIEIRSIPEYVKGYDFSVFGLTKDWKSTLLTEHKAEIHQAGSRDAEPFTGDLLKVGTVCLFSVVALVAGVYMVLQRKKRIIE